jgi:predicted enzyme related to lactoylglutathione lyase
VVHFEIQARDPSRLREFYAQLFQWDVGDGPIMSVPPGIGGPEVGVGGHIRAAEASRVSLYVQVRDVRESQDRAVALGGAATLAPFDVHGGPTLAGVTDPEGNPLMLVQQ